MRSNRVSKRLRSFSLHREDEIQESEPGGTGQPWTGSPTTSRCKSAVHQEHNTIRSLSGAAMQFESSLACARTAGRMPCRAAAGCIFSACESRRSRGPIPDRISSQGGLFIQLPEICGMAGRSRRGSPREVGDWIYWRHPHRRGIDPAGRREKCAGPRIANQEVSGSGESACVQRPIHQRIGKEAPASYSRGVTGIQRFNGSGHGRFYWGRRNDPICSGGCPRASGH